MSLQYRMMNTFLGKILEEQEGFGDKLSSFDTKTRMRLLYIVQMPKNLPDTIFWQVTVQMIILILREMAKAKCLVFIHNHLSLLLLSTPYYAKKKCGGCGVHYHTHCILSILQGLLRLNIRQKYIPKKEVILAFAETYVCFCIQEENNNMQSSYLIIIQTVSEQKRPSS